MASDRPQPEPLKSRYWFGKFMEGFWAWYERHYLLNLSLTTGLFALQLVHLYWLTTHVVMFMLFGRHFFSPSEFWQAVIIIVDYTEIPALISTSLLYLYEMRGKFKWKQVWFLIALNSQWLHLFWITDEFVVDAFAGTATTTILPLWLAWVAILIDYLELPVIADTVITLKRSVFKQGFFKSLKEQAKYHIWKL